MNMSIRQRTEQFEIEMLAPRAMRAVNSTGREKEEANDSVRTCFQRDRDRILHSKAFRRLMNKTQVFISPEGDHYRTRMTHTLEVTQIARTVSRGLRLNEDLTEAIALGHDVGHPPFGHAGEDALDQAVQRIDPQLVFRHYQQSVRVLSILENLNLTHETLAGIGGHSKGRRDIGADDTEPPSPEAGVVRVADRVAYLNHDLDDALRAGWLTMDDLPDTVRDLGERHSQRVGLMVQDLIESSKDKIRFSDKVQSQVNEMKEFLFDRFYLDYPAKFSDVDKAKGVVKALFEHYSKSEGWQGALDYVSGMTDRFATRDYERLFLPQEWQD